MITMDKKLKRLINEEVARNLKKRDKYFQTRALVESMVRESLLKKIMENDDNKKTKAAQVRQLLNDPAINKSGLARKIDGLSGNDDARRSEISKIARGEWTPDTHIQNDIIHTIASDTE